MEFNLENLNILSNALEEKVPWQKAVSLEKFQGQYCKCRSNDKRTNGEAKEETWLFFQGHDQFFFHGLDYSKDREMNKVVATLRDLHKVGSNPHAFSSGGVEGTITLSQESRRLLLGKITNSCGEEVSLCDAIVILSCDHDRFISSRSSRGVSPNCDGSDNEDKGTITMEETRSSLCFIGFKHLHS
ncbi:hypothetical protein HAX54_018569 [Datura stramonium]|uniref:Uncharacterized protein n=1 Tax=Datura stramonium TaxID=4076 RepID=A0ABS8S227_DATST|nr:hypothetical protein [Datura stramonium]